MTSFATPPRACWQRASGRELALYARVQRAIADRLAPLGADLGALDAARFAPVPGTLKTDVNTRVEWWIQGGLSARGYAYTLPQLATALGLELSTQAHPVIDAALRREPGERATDPAKSAAGRKGWAVRWRRALGDFEILRRLRGGGFNRGMRNRGAFFYALLLSYAPAQSGGRMDAADVAAHLATFGAACRPALTVAEQRNALRQARQAKAPMSGYVSNDRLFHELAVTDIEASYLQTIRSARPRPQPVKRIRPADRRAVVRQTIAALGHVPSTRDMAELLKTTTQGVNVNWTTIARDYQALGRHCQVEVEQAGSSPDEAMTRSSASDTGHLSPDTEGPCPQEPMMDGSEEMAADPKEILNGSMYREKPLRLGSGLEPAHLALALTGRLVRYLGAIVGVLVCAVDQRRHHSAAGRWVTAQLVRDQPARLAALSFQELAEEPSGRPPIAPRLHKDVEHVAILVHGPPQILLPPPDLGSIRVSQRYFGAFRGFS